MNGRMIYHLIPAAFMRVSFKYLFVMAIMLMLCIPHVIAAEPGTVPIGSVLADSLSFPGEVYVLTADELADYNINTVEDILEMLPGLSFWRKGPEGSTVAFSVDGQSSRGITLLVNGVPFTDPYNDGPLLRFVPLSRLIQVEVIFSGSAGVSGVFCPGGLVNIVIEEGGRQGPITVADFTNGHLARRSRRIWFSSPGSSINVTFAYDEYLQDASRSLSESGSGLIGLYNSRSILAELSLTTDDDHHLLLRIQKYDDSYKGSMLYPAVPSIGYKGEGIGYNGFDSQLRYSRGAFSVLLRQRVLEMKRYSGRISGHLLGGSVKWDASVRELSVKTFINARAVSFENRLWGEYFHPEYSLAEGGVAVAGSISKYMWRGGLYGCYHSETGLWLGGEMGISRGNGNGAYQWLKFSRRSRVPAAEELFQPELNQTIEGDFFSSVGNTELDLEKTDEVSLGFGFSEELSVDIFVRKERRRIIFDQGSPAVYKSTGDDEVAGVRSGYRGDARLFGTGIGYSIGVEYFGKRSEYTPGVPEYRFMGNLRLKRRFFKDTETLSLLLSACHVGPRNWAESLLERYSVLNASFSMTVMSATVRFEMRNILDTRYETVPGYWMPERHFRMGVIWNILD